MKTEIPEDFEITEKMRKWADEKIPRVDIDRETEKFIDYWLAHGKRMANWEATWRNWMRRCPEMGGYMKSPASTPRKPEQITEEQRQRDREAWERDMQRLGVRVLK